MSQSPRCLEFTFKQGSFSVVSRIVGWGRSAGLKTYELSTGLGVLAGRMLLIVFSFLKVAGSQRGNRRAYRAAYPAEILVVLEILATAVLETYTLLLP
jgi:hypothetical protein